MMRFELPFPPTVWDIYVGWGKTRRKSPEYANWVQDCGWFIRGRNDRIDTPFSLCVALKRPHNRMDLDNRLKPILDVLQHYQVIKNDNLCERITMTWDADIKSDCVVIVQRAEEALAA